MLKQLLVSTFACLAVMATAFAHGGTIEGTITDDSNDRPVPFASVQIDGSNLGTTADSLGHFVLSHVPTHSRMVVVSAVGYETKRVTVEVADGVVRRVDAALHPSPVDVGQIVITGTRTPRYIKDVPVFTEVVSRASIEEKSAHNIFEALDGEAGVKVEQQCQACNFSILRMQGLGADHTQVLLDGQPVYTGLASVYGLQQMSTADVARIEIVKGAGSALYGSNAVAGAINIVSEVPRTTEGDVSIEFGEHGTNTYSFRGGTRKDNLALFLFAQLSEQDEWDATGDVTAPDGVDEPDGWIDRVRASSKNIGFNLFLDDVFTVDRLTLRGRLMSENRQGGWLTDNLFENPFAPGTERIATDRVSGQAEYQVWLANGMELNASVSLSNQKRDATNDTFLGDYEVAYGETPPVDLLRPYVADENLLVTNLNLMKPFGSQHRVLVGVQFTHNELEESGMYLDGETSEPYSSSSTKRAYEVGLYAQDEFKATEHLEMVAGLRFDYHDSEDQFRGSGDVLPEGLEPLQYEESTLNPRFSIKYAVSEPLVLRASAGTGYRVPYGFSEDLHLCSGSPRVYKGGDLKPEKSVSFSMTADYTTRTFDASLNLYRTDLKDAIAFADADPEVYNLGYTYQWENIDDAYVTGAEFNSSVAVAAGLVVGGRFELFDGKYDHPRVDWAGTPYEDISRHISRYPSTSGGLKVEYTLRTWSLTADADYKGKMYIDLTEPEDAADVHIHETESYAIVNARLGKRLFDRYDVHLGVKNLTDYTQEVKHISDAAFMYAPVYGRLVFGGVQVSL